MWHVEYMDRQIGSNHLLISVSDCVLQDLWGDGELQRLGVDDSGGEDTLEDCGNKTVHTEYQCVAPPAQSLGYLKTVT